MNARKTSLVALIAVCVALAGCFKPSGEGSGGGSGAGVGGDAGVGGGTAAGGGTGGAVGGGAGGGLGAGGGAQQSTLSLSPTATTLPIGSSQPFVASRVLEDGSVTDVTSQVTWTVDPADVLSVSGGVAKAMKAGQAKLHAQLAGLKATAQVTVPAATLVKIELSPAMLSIGQGATAALSVLGTLGDGSPLDVTALATLTSSAPAVVSPGAGGTVRGLAPGAATITATVAGLSSTAAVTVTPAKLTSIAVIPSTASLPVGSKLQFKARGTYDDLSQADISASVVWNASAPVVQLASDGTATGVSAGSAAITASLAGQSGTATVTVNAATLVRIDLTPAPLALTVGQSRQLTATATFSDMSTLDVTQGASWLSADPSVAGISNAAGARGQASAIKAGAVELSARVGAITGRVQLTVSASPLVSLTINPLTATLAPGAKESFSVKGTFADNTTTDLTQSAVWSSSDASVVSVSNAAGSRGEATAVAAGMAQVRAGFGGLTTSAQVKVNAAVTVDGLAIAPAMITLEAGRTVGLKAMAHYTDGTLKDVSEQCTWSSSAAAFASVSNSMGTRGQVKGVADGAATITAVFGAFSATGSVKVSPPVIVAVNVDPATLRLPIGLYEYVDATTAMSDGSSESVSGTVTWTSTNPAVADVQVYQGKYAYVIAASAGTTSIKASLPNGMSATIAVTVTTASITSVQLGPAQPKLPVGGKLDMTAIGVFSDFSTSNVKYSAAWSSSNPAVASVGNSDYTKGALTALSAGTTTITANYDGIIGTTLVTVSSATLMTIQVTPFSPKLPVGFETYLQATGIYTDNTTQDMTYQVSWSTSASNLASVSYYGRVTPVAPGTVTISAHFMGVTGTNVITVSAATLTSIAISPGMSTVAVQATKQLTATGTFSDATTMDVTQYVTWLSGTTAVANVSNAYPTQGQAKGLSPGNAMITAIRGSVSASTSLQVQ